MERVPTGIKQLDELLGGGLVKGTWSLVYGPPGTGKTVFGMQFTWEGIKRGEVVSYDSLDRPFPFHRAYFNSFGWDISKYEREGKFVPIQSFPHYANYKKEPHIIYYNPSSFEEMRTVDVELSRRKVSRLVCGDYAEVFWSSIPVQDILDINRWTLQWAHEDGITGMDLVTGTPGHPESDRLRAMIEKDVNSVIYFRFNEGRREMRIVKMEGVEHPLDWLPFTITREGIRLDLKRSRR